MPGPFPLAMLGPTITAAGITAPSYADILASLQASFQGIYGSDAVISPDSQDGQWLAVLAKGYFDVNQMAIAVYNAFSPAFAQGTGLSSLVKINGLKRLLATFSTAVGNVVGTAGTVVVNGVVSDNNGNLWALPPSVTIPGGGTISVTVVAQVQGNISALAGTINKISNPQVGWQSFVSTADAVPGLPVETDSALRNRQAVSTGLPATGPLGAMLGALANLPGATKVAVYENNSTTADANSAPAHSVYAVV